MITVKLNFATSRPFLRYRYEGGPWQLSNVFEVEPGRGTYRFSAIDNIGCMASITLDEENLDFPLGDGEIHISKTVTDGQAEDHDVFFKFGILGPVSFSNILASVNEPFIIRNLPYGNYTIFEETPPSGYINTGESLEVELTADDKIANANFVNEIDPDGVPAGDGQLTVKKAVTNPEATFEDLVFRANVVGPFITYGVEFSINDPVVLVNIPYGAYDIEEVSLPENFFLNTIAPSRVVLSEENPTGEVDVVNTYGIEGPGEITIFKEVYDGSDGRLPTVIDTNVVAGVVVAEPESEPEPETPPIDGGPTLNPIQKSSLIIAGVSYPVIQLGNQEFTTVNLRNTFGIPEVQNPNHWKDLTTPARVFYKNEPSTVYGLLYNFYALSVINSNLPGGWRVFSDNDFKVLEFYMGMVNAELNQTGHRGEASLIGTKMKTVGNTLWVPPISDPSHKYYNPGFVPATNESKFSGVPSGNLNPIDTTHDGPGFYSKFRDMDIWTTTAQGSSGVMRALSFNQNTIFRAILDKRFGFCVRLVRNI